MNAETISACPFHQSTQIPKSCFPALSKLRKRARWRQGVQNALDPDPVDAVRRGLVKVSVGQSRCVAFHERIPIEREVRIQESRRPGLLRNDLLLRPLLAAIQVIQSPDRCPFRSANDSDATFGRLK